MSYLNQCGTFFFFVFNCSHIDEKLSAINENDHGPVPLSEAECFQKIQKQYGLLGLITTGPFYYLEN